MSCLENQLDGLSLDEAIFKDIKFFVSGDVNPKVIELLKSGGAERMNYFSDFVTHLICGEDPEENDLTDANELYEVPAVTQKWIIMCVRLKKLVNTKPYIYVQMKLFTGMTFTISKLKEDLNILWAIITYHGGKVQLNFDHNVTHLVTTDTTTAKYEKAISLEGAVEIVTPDWIIECVKTQTLADVALYHPKLIDWPKVVKHESTTAITGFEPEQSELDAKALESNPPDSTQALLDKLKQRMPWNQQKTEGQPPPNVVAPSFTGGLKGSLPVSVAQQQLQQPATPVAQQANFQAQQQQQQQQQHPNGVVNTVVNTANPQQIPRSVVHHTPQFQQQQNVFAPQNMQQQQRMMTPQVQQQQQQPQQQPQQQQQRPMLPNQLQMHPQMMQQNQFNQQMLQQQRQLVQQQQQQQQIGQPQLSQMQIPQQQPQLMHQQQLRPGLSPANKPQGIQMQPNRPQMVQQANQQFLINQQKLQQGQQFQGQQPQPQQPNQVVPQQAQGGGGPQGFLSPTAVGQQQPQQFSFPPQQFVQQQQQQQQQPQFQQGQQQQPARPVVVNQQQQQQHIWQQQGLRHPGNLVQQPQGPRIQWSPQAGQPGPPMQRQFIQLDAQTHQQLQQMAPEERALFVAKLQKQRQLLMQKQQLQMQQQRGGHILIRGQVPPGLNHQQQMQWLQQQAKQQGIVLQPNLQQQMGQNIQHTPGLSPIQNPQFTPDQQHQLQLQRQFRLQQLQLQREQAQKNQLVQQQQVVNAVGQAPMQPLAAAQPPPRPIGQPQAADTAPSPAPPPNPNGVEPNVPQNPLVNAKTKTALANMLSIRLQSGSSSIGPGPESIAEPSAAGTLRMMTAQHNAALNPNNRPQDILALQNRRAINGPNGELIRPVTPAVPATPQPEPPKLQYSPRTTLPIQHRPGPFYGHNPNLKLPPDLFLLGCIFVVVELERYLEESLPGWQQKIEKHGGEIEKQYCNRVTHVLCETQRHGVVMQAMRDYKRCVTLYWLSDVIKRKQVLPPWTALHLPAMYLDTVPASKHLISLSGFTGSERNRVKHMIKYTGATLTTYFTRHNTLLIAAKAEGPKFAQAKKWGTPVVNVQWLTDVMLGNFAALNQFEHIKYQQFNSPPNFCFDPIHVPVLMQPWKMPINISQESYERVKRSASPVTIPKKIKKLKTEHSTDENDNVDTQMTGQNVSHRVLFSMSAEVEDLKKIVRQLGGAVAQSHQDCTHLVMPALARTNKLLHCICRGVQILPESWLRDSLAAGKFLDESNYVLDAREFNSHYRCDFSATLATKNRCKLFEGRYFFITPSVYPSKKVLAELIQSCGGVVERVRRSAAQIEATNINSPYSYIILTHENDLHLVADLLRNKKEKVRIVCNVELILSAIVRQSIEVEPFAVKVL